MWSWHHRNGDLWLGENGLIRANQPGLLKLDTPAGRVNAYYEMDGAKVTWVKLFNVPAFLAHEAVPVMVEGLGELIVDIAYGGNFYIIVEPPNAFAGLERSTAAQLLAWSPKVREAVNAQINPVHPEDPTVCGASHVLWTGQPKQQNSHAANAVFYGDKALDRSPVALAPVLEWHSYLPKGI